MKKTIFYFLALTASFTIQAQEYVNQVLILNEGYFDYTINEIVEPASIGSYNPVTEMYTEVLQLEGMRFGSDLIIDNEVYYVAADTKIFKIDLNTHEIISSVECQGVRNLTIVGNKLIATRGEYLVNFDSYLHVYNTEDLSFELALDNESGPQWATQNIISVGNKAYFAINNAYEFGNEKGIIGIYDLETLVYEELDLGPDAKNPDNLVKSGEFLYTVNNKDWSGASISKVAIDLSENVTVDLASASTGCGTSALREDKMVYQISMETSLNEFDLNIMNNSGPVNGTFMNFYELKENPVSSEFYTSETDYFSFGKVHIYDVQNIETGAFDVGINPGTIVFDVRSSAGIVEGFSEVEIYPNPVQNNLFISDAINEKIIRNLTGEEIYRFSGTSVETKHLTAGMYFIECNNQSIPFVKK
ncbi:MAG: T9SS type A sorting domain-containing protein [Crocinitomicaceae bacterium]|nr:T9SS type A sorting domain-containing protein [Crocinitomicaceae bacterium]